MSDKDSSNSSQCVEESKVQISQLMVPNQANPAGNVHGGTIMKLIDEGAYIVASKHTHKNCVTASVDRIDFLKPVFIGNVVVARASINYTGNTSMEIGVRVDAECLKTGKKTHVASAYLTFVSLDDEGNPTKIPEIIPETEVEKRRYREAQERIRMRKERMP